MNEKDHTLTRCREMIERELNWGPSEDWSNLDFENLSEKIFEKTQVRLSISTLKRLWGKVRYDSSPTPATLNVLARFLGFEHWRELYVKTGIASVAHDESLADVTDGKTVLPDDVPPGHAVRTFKGQLVRIMLGTAAVVLVGMFVFLLVGGKMPAAEEAGVVFEIREVSNGLPNSVVFTYDIGNLPADSVFIQQSWDPSRRELVSPTGRHHTSIYYRPGYFEAKLIVDGVIKKEGIVFIKTQGWKGIIEGDSPVYLGADEMQQPGGIGIDAATLREKTGAPIFTNRWSMFTNVREFEGMDANNFTLDVILRNTAMVEECLCRKVKITLLQKGDAIVIPLAAKGCTADIGLLAPSRFFSGKDNDLSAFGCDFDDFQHVRCQVADHQFSIFINDKPVFQEAIAQPLAELVGLRIVFEGTGEIQHVNLSSSGKVILNDQFDLPAEARAK